MKVSIAVCWNCRHLEWYTDGAVHCLGQDRKMEIPKGLRMMGGHLWRGAKKLYYDEEEAEAYRRTFVNCPKAKKDLFGEVVVEGSNRSV